MDAISRKKKRLLKKQKARENIERLKAAGISDKKIIKELKNKPVAVEKTIKELKKEKVKREREIARQKRASARYSYLTKELGINTKDASKMRYWSEKRYSEFVRKKEKEIERKKRAAERKKQKENRNTLMIFWYEKTRDYHDYEEIMRYKRSFKRDSLQYLLEQTRDAYLSDEGTLIGAARAIATDNPKATKAFYSNFNDGTFAAHNGWMLIYEGVASPRKYRELVIALLITFDLMYESTEKTIFWDSFKRELMKVNPDTCNRLIRDLDI
ncbi:hypothetical protein B4092_4713 [Bacillus licheniformis]|uniref:hypothetical protein n=1 Tax=Bacillus licheniformis TaxID=1402 RepID=UPI000778FCD4|nr:hypothetical protein [Bacillus licheniformis]KYC77738.1 hypothetical protein B4092_4713 [Bacillus licheniformis]